MTERTRTTTEAQMTLKDTPNTSDLEKATSPVEYLVEKFL